MGQGVVSTSADTKDADTKDAADTMEAMAEAVEVKGRKKRKNGKRREKEMSFIEHLAELRSRILRSLVYVCVGAVVGWFFREQIIVLVKAPIKDLIDNERIIDAYRGVIQPLFLRLQVSIVGGLVISFPFVLYEVLAFIWPGLLPHERRFAAPLIPFALIMFVAGIILSYYLFPIAVHFMVRFAEQESKVIVFMPEYISLVVRVSASIGLVFQMPLVLMLLAKMGLVTARGLLSRWRHATVIIFAGAAIVTPTIDPVNMSLLAVPIIFLYLLSIVLVAWVQRGRVSV